VCVQVGWTLLAYLRRSHKSRLSKILEIISWDKLYLRLTRALLNICSTMDHPCYLRHTPPPLLTGGVH